MKNDLAEYRLVSMWQDLISRENVLVTETGEPLRVIYPGRLNDDHGADFRDAVIATGNGIQQGEIELHVSSGDWKAHGHHLDPAYNSVILHVVFQEDGSLTARRANGETVATLSMHRYLEKRLQSASLTLPCSQIAANNTEKVKDILDEAGEARFREKAHQFKCDLDSMDAGQALYRGIMGALGYTKNKIPCLKLAERVTLPLLESSTQSGLSEKESLLHQQALLLGTAGLLPSQRGLAGENPDEYISLLEKLWSLNFRRETLPSGSWNLFKVRPNNSPLRRIVALSHLIFRFRGKGLLASLIDSVAETPAENARRLIAKLLVSTEDYWATHYDFGRACSQLSSALLGPDRAAEIVINIISPFMCALDNSSLRKKAWDMYRTYPVSPANSIEKHLQKQLGLSKGFINSARRQQGLIYLYKTLCTQGKCHECALGK